ncbi:MAG: BlaI/MecI/CopY family transcriptional regulator [Thermoguttaceae bacterium]|jgi:predicted transcriptional regulator
MKKQVKVRPSVGEIAILAMLWQEGPLSLAQAHQRFGQYGRPVGYPTMQTRLNRLSAKGWVRRSEDRPSLYSAFVTADEVAAGHLDQWLSMAKTAGVAPLVAHLIAESPLTTKEIQELKKLLTEAEKTTRK